MKTIIPHKDAPSGYIAFENYKAPFMPNPKPYFGFRGILIQDSEEGVIQCCICGKWFASLGSHINRKHSIDAEKYKKRFGLGASTALVGEIVRIKLIESGKRIFQMRSKSILKKLANARKSGNLKRKTNGNQTMEFYNKNGTCPAQLIHRLKRIALDLGHRPSYQETKKVDNGLVKGIERGGRKWNDYISKELGWSIVKRGQGLNQKAWDRTSLIQVLIEFKNTYKREPSKSDFKRGLLPSSQNFRHHFGAYSIAKKLAYTN